jgi:hypothetical protein
MAGCFDLTRVVAMREVGIRAPLYRQPVGEKL